ncbi:MAG TPA: class I SAM-dependent methyltransferase [Rhabdochlamydiaceae bacterium]|nr:class I SAM-dependent methyltransferase [Rhabdochlamydiaceae bacterium]
MKYFLVDSGKQQKLERFGDYLLVRPCSQAIWEPRLPYEKWSRADGVFTREKENKWNVFAKLPKSWTVEIEQIQFKIAPTDFGHLGVFPEHAVLWKWMEKKMIRYTEGSRPNILNLFAYSGGATLAAAKAGAKVCHLDASKGMVSWARENAALNGLTDAPIRWIVEDVVKFLKREIKRGSRYEGIILDPPSFGRGNQGEVFKIERDLNLILELCRNLLSNEPLFLILSTHTPGFTPTVMRHILSQTMLGLEGKIEAGEMLLSGQDTLDLPCGSYARWHDEA